MTKPGSLRGWLASHRVIIIVIVSPIMGIIVPLPGYIVASFFVLDGGHGVTPGRPASIFIVVVMILSAIIWGIVLTLGLPRNRR
jgi:hypothetical protein